MPEFFPGMMFTALLFGVCLIVAVGLNSVVKTFRREKPAPPKVFTVQTRSAPKKQPRKGKK